MQDYYKLQHKVESSVRGEQKKFYSISVSLVKDLATLGKPLLKALGALFGGVGNEVGGSEREKVLKQPDGATVTERIKEVSAIDPRLAEVKLAERNKALDEIVAGLSDEKNGLLMAKIVMDSMRDEFNRKDARDPKKIEEFYHSVDMETFAEMLKGTAQANAGVLGPLGRHLLSQVGSVAEKFVDKIPETVQNQG